MLVIFLPTPSARRATLPIAPHLLFPQFIFLPTPSARRATYFCCLLDRAEAISTHALREEGDRRPSNCPARRPYFYPRPPRGGRQQPAYQGRASLMYFYPRPPRGGRPAPAQGCRYSAVISTHALREEGDGRASVTRPCPAIYFYPRPPRGGRLFSKISTRAVEIFLPTPSARRATGLLTPPL